MSLRKKNPSLAHLLSIAWLFSASAVLAQAPPVLVDAQQTLGSGYANARSVAVAKNGTVYVSDQNSNAVFQLATALPAASTQTTVATGTFTLAGPSALAIDNAGDLYIGDYPNSATRVIECLATKGVLNGTCNSIYLGGAGGLASQPLSLAVDRSGKVFVGIAGQSAGIYNVTSGTANQLNITGLPPGFTPAALARDASTNIYFVDSSAAVGGVYLAAENGGNSNVPAIPIVTGAFATANPSGIVLDAANNLFVLSQLLINGTTSTQVIEIPGESPITPYLIPSAGLGTTTGMTLDANGNIDVVDQTNGLVTQLDYLNAINLGAATVFSAGTAIPFNFEFNTQATFAGFQAVTVGDLGTTNGDVVAATGGGCTFGPLGVTVSAYEPYVCSQPFQATPQYPGSRASAIQVNGPSTEILASSPVYETGQSGAEVVYPLSATTTVTPLEQPQGVAISGFDQTVYVADFDAGYVYSSNSLTGTSPNIVDTGVFPLEAPSAVAMNGEGDLYIADFDQSEIIVVPTRTGKAPFQLNTSFLLQHPISLALDYMGNLYIGDAGPDGDEAVSSSPGYVVEVPYNGSPSILTISGQSIIFPQALATDQKNGALYIGDGGDGVSTLGQVVSVPSGGGKGSVVLFPGQTAPTDPTGLTLDAAEDLYVLDGTALNITVVPPTGASYLVGFPNATLTSPSALASSAGGQSFVIADIGNGTGNSLLYLNGNRSGLAFGGVQENTESALETATLYNIGNAALKLSNPATVLTQSRAVFDVLGSSTCTKNLNVKAAASCNFNVQFSPKAVRAYTGQLLPVSNAYNNGTPVLNLSGTGIVASDVAYPEHKKDDRAKVQARSLKNSPRGRKSFKHSRRGKTQD